MKTNDSPQTTYQLSNLNKFISKTAEPELQDYVKHKAADMAGIVIAKYPGYLAHELETQFIDVRGTDEKIYYATPAFNWEVVHTAYELGQTDVKK